MDFQKTKAKTARWNLFGKIDLLGSFDFYTALITLDAISIRDIKRTKEAFRDGLHPDRPLSPDQYEALSKVMPLAVHELTHFLDATSTVWGLEHLTLMSEAYSSEARFGCNEDQFVRAKVFYDHVRALRLPDYYTLVEEDAPGDRPWNYQVSVGHIFTGTGTPSTQPIVFARFADAAGQFLARSPISMVALLEASAMAQELFFHGRLVQHCVDGFRHVEQREFGKRVLDAFYDQRLTEYSVAAHIVANRLQTTDIGHSLAHSALLVRICLNATDGLFEQLAANAPVAEVLQIGSDHEFVSRVRTGLRQGSRPMLFFLLASALHTGADAEHSPWQNVRDVAAILGFDLNHFHQQAIEKAAKLTVALEASPLPSIRTLARMGSANLRAIRPDAPDIVFADLQLPPVILGDSNEVHLLSRERVDGLSVDACFDELYAGQSWVERFAEACVARDDNRFA